MSTAMDDRFGYLISVVVERIARAIGGEPEAKLGSFAQDRKKYLLAGLECLLHEQARVDLSLRGQIEGDAPTVSERTEVCSQTLQLETVLILGLWTELSALGAYLAAEFGCMHGAGGG